MKTIYILLITLLATACIDDDPVDPASLLPPITMTGENTFGCLIDGKFFRPRDGRSTINSDNKGLRVVRTENNNLELHVYDRKSDRTGSLFIHLENFYTRGEGEYLIQNATGMRGIDGPDHNYIYGRLFKSNQYQTFLSIHGGIINISVIDTTIQGRRIFAGEFRATLATSMDTIQVELGRFDINSQTLSQTAFD